MSQDFGLPEPDVTEPEPSPTGGLPSDFFEEPGRDGTDAHAEEALPQVEPLSPRQPATPPPAPKVTDRRPVLPIVGAVLLGNVVLFLGGGLAGWALAKKDAVTGQPPASPGADPQVTTLARSVESKASRAEVNDLEARVDGLKAEVAGLARALDRVQARLETSPKSATASAADLKPLLGRVDDLTQATKGLTPLPAELHALAERFGALDKRLESLRAQVASLPKQIKEAVSPTPRSDAVEPAKGTSSAAEAQVKGAALYREGKFAQARDVFLKQAADAPDDARLWYSAALANGFATGDWGGETARLVQRGVERERAGTPGRAEIDALFRDLPPDQGGDWLRGWREQAMRR
jgi:hypothetical protein